MKRKEEGEKKKKSDLTSLILKIGSINDEEEPFLAPTVELD